MVHTLPSFIAQGGLGVKGAEIPSSVADVIEVECQPSQYDGYITVSDNELRARCEPHDGGSIKWFSTTGEPLGTEGQIDRAIPLDNDGSATVVVIADKCRAGETTVVVDQTEYPFETYMTTYAALPPEPSGEGVWATPANAVEDDIHSSVATIIHVAFPVTDTPVDINAEQLLSRCSGRVEWLNAEGNVVGGAGPGKGRIESEIDTDNDGNAFVVLLGKLSCQPGRVRIFADLEEAESFQTLSTTFEIEGPRPTVPEPSFQVQKEQELAGEPSFTKASLGAELKQVVDYKIIVSNTGPIPITLAKLSDPHCTNVAGPQNPTLNPGESTDYTCEHELTSVGTYTNQAEVEITQHHTERSNVVEVTVPPPHGEFTIEKTQQIAGEATYTTKVLNAMVGEIVDYRIVVNNTGRVALAFTEFIDSNCEGTTGGPGGALLQPGESTQYTCSYTLTTAGPHMNVATVTGTPEEGFPLTHRSNEVVVDANPPEFTIEKQQRLSGEYTTRELTGTVGEVVDYEITVTNTGPAPITLSHFEDADCEGLSGGASELAVAAAATYTCSHALTAPGDWTNQASVDGAGKPKVSNNVVLAAVEPEVTIEKLQRYASHSFTKSEVNPELNEVVYYEIIVTNIGIVPVRLSSFTDTRCEGISGGAAELAPDASTTYTCRHTLTDYEPWQNDASIEADGQSKTSNQVVARAEKQEKGGQCTIEGTKFHLLGVEGLKKKTFTIHITGPFVGKIKTITVKLDGHTETTFTASQAKNHTLTLAIHPPRQAGKHTVSVRFEPEDTDCAFVRNKVFVRAPHIKKPPPPTG